MNQMAYDKKQIIPVMIGTMLSLLLAALDNTIVGTAMPRIIADLNGMDKYSWPFTAYILCSTIAILIAGKLSDILGRKPIFLAGLVSFLVGSALCGISGSMIQLIAFRGLQGIGGGIVISNSFIIVGDLFNPRERGKYMGILSSMFGLASVFGPAVGGFITDLLSWRWIFYINIPLGIFSIILMAIKLPWLKQENRVIKIDYSGSIALIAGVVPFLLIFTWGGTVYNWLSPQILGMAVFSIICFVLFVFIERKAPHPILSPALFRESVFNSSIIIMFLSNAVMFCGILFVPLFIQGVLGVSASISGSVTTPMMVGLTISAIAAGQIVSRTGRYKLLATCGILINGAGLALIVTMGPQTSVVSVLLASALMGLGAGIIIPIYNVITQAAFPQSQLGTVTSSVQFFRNMGAAIGTSLFGYVLTVSINSGFKKIDLSQAPPMIKDVLTNPRVLSNGTAVAAIQEKIPQAFQSFFIDLVRQAREVLATSLHQVFIFGVVIVVGTLVVILIQKEKPIKATY